MRGPPNTKIKLRIVRQGQDNPIELTIVRQIVTVHSVRARLEGNDVAYIRISAFNEKTSDEIKKTLNQLSTQTGIKSVKGYIIDLRNNPGGLLDQAIFVSDAFLETGEIVSTRGRKAEETQRFIARPGDLAKGKPIIVLINGGSASASEIVAGALQDHTYRSVTVVKPLHGEPNAGPSTRAPSCPVRTPGRGDFLAAVSWEAAHQALQTIGCAPKELSPLLRGISVLYRREIWPPLLLGGVCGRSLISDFL
jgi:hypothetical protein